MDIRMDRWGSGSDHQVWEDSSDGYEEGTPGGLGGESSRMGGGAELSRTKIASLYLAVRHSPPVSVGLGLWHTMAVSGPKLPLYHRIARDECQQPSTGRRLTIYFRRLGGELQVSEGGP